MYGQVICPVRMAYDAEAGELTVTNKRWLHLEDVCLSAETPVDGDVVCRKDAHAWCGCPWRVRPASAGDSRGRSGRDPADRARLHHGGSRLVRADVPTGCKPVCHRKPSSAGNCRPTRPELMVEETEQEIRIRSLNGELTFSKVNGNGNEWKASGRDVMTSGPCVGLWHPLNR